MSYYVIGIGGTGAKCIEALVHLCAAGCMPEGEVYALFVDPDKANGSLERARVTFKRYAACRKGLACGRTPLLRNMLTTAHPNIWSPVNDQQTSTLEDVFSYHALDGGERHLFDVLFSRKERQTSLERGFRGHPSVGAAVMAQTRLGDEEPWRTFRQRVRADQGSNRNPRIFLFGSIFGGTGAAGFPTIAKLIRNELRDGDRAHARIGGTLVLPYFSFRTDAQSNGQTGRDEMRARSEDFLMSTKAALQSYHARHADHYDRLYMVGDAQLSRVERFSTGAREQRNEPHFVELYAALAAVDFFENTENSAEVPRFPMTARETADRLAWGDLPGGTRLRRRMGQLARFAFAYLAVYYAMLEDIRQHGGGHRAPWYVDFFQKNGVPLDGDSLTALESVRDYCRSYLQWLAHLHNSAQNQDVELFRWRAFANTSATKGDSDGQREMELDFDTRRFDGLALPEREAARGGLAHLWEQMAQRRGRAGDPEADGVGEFVRALYDCCALPEGQNP